MDDLLEHMEQYGICDTLDWQSDDRDNEALIRYQHQDEYNAAKKKQRQRIMDSNGSTVWLDVS